ncbi:MAG: glutaredoxin 3 [Gammaproteobacteria bacterium]|jgi:glutaredoxin 3
MVEVRMYCTAICPYCFQAERLLKSKGVKIQKIFIDSMTDGFGELARLTGRRTVPQIFIGDLHVGGYDDLADLEFAGELDPLLMT